MGVEQTLLLAGAGLLAGLMNSIAGGGTLVTFPSLLASGLGSITANATSTVALLPGTAGSTVGYRKNLQAMRSWLLLFSPVSLMGGVVGSLLLLTTPSSVFDVLVPFLILFATVLFMLHSLVSRLFRPAMGPPSRRWIAGAMVFQFGVSVYGGYFGAGIGILMLASLSMLGFTNVHEMNVVKNVLGFLINVVAALCFVVKGMVDWPSAGIVAVGAVTGGFVGAHMAQKVNPRLVRGAIVGIGFVLAGLLFLRQFLR